MIRRLLLVVLAMSLGGCSGGSTPLDTPVKASGKVVDAQGKPIGNVTLNLQPLERGYSKTVELKADGVFSVETQSGKYAYFFTPKAGAKQLPPQVTNYAEASMDRTVQVADGQPLDIQIQ